MSLISSPALEDRGRFQFEEGLNEAYPKHWGDDHERRNFAAIIHSEGQLSHI